MFFRTDGWGGGSLLACSLTTECTRSRSENVCVYKLLFSSRLQDIEQLFKASSDPSSATKTSSSGWNAKTSSRPRRMSFPGNVNGSIRGSSSPQPAERSVGHVWEAHEGTSEDKPSPPLLYSHITLSSCSHVTVSPVAMQWNNILILQSVLLCTIMLLLIYK